MNDSELNTETIKNRIKAEARRLHPTLTPSGKPETRLSTSETPQSLMSSATKETGSEKQNLDILLSYRDEDFIRSTYRTLLKREPDPQELYERLAGLKSGQLKIDVLWGISQSEEGRKANVEIKGLWLRYWVNRFYRLPVAGYLIRIFAAVFNLPKIIININNYQALTDARLAGKADRETLQTVLADKADRETLLSVSEKLQTVLADKADREAVGALTTTVQDMSAQLKDHRLNILDQQRRLLLLLEEVRKSFPESISPQQIENVLKEEDHLLDALYMTFEDRFRGTRAEIKRRLSVYLPYVVEMASRKKDVDILDVGCGRGEWLELLQENGYEARGIDINRVALRQCEELGLNVTESDVIEYLRGLKRASLDVITGFHIIEHLSFKTLTVLLDEALAVLKSGGMIIFETPNPANILVSAYDFYRDPGHVKPLHPDTVPFIAESRGFLHTGSYFVSCEGSDSILIPSTEWPLNDLNDYIRVPRDFALIGCKP